jgi:hypothetical protein
VRRIIVVVATACALLIASAAPASAANVMVIGRHPYALWPPNYCSDGAGYGIDYGPSGTSLTIVAQTWSLKAIGSACDDPSNATSNTFAALSRLDVLIGSTWYQCGSLAHEVNANNTSYVAASRLVANCGRDRLYRVRAEWRITYGGTNQNDGDFGPYWYWYS